MNGQGSNHPFTSDVNPGHSQSQPLPNGMVIKFSPYNRNFFFNNPGQYNISWTSDFSSGDPQAQLGQLTRNAPKTNGGAIPPTTPSAGAIGVVGGAGSKATSSGGSISSCSSCEWCVGEYPKCPDCGGNLVPVYEANNK